MNNSYRQLIKEMENYCMKKEDYILHENDNKVMLNNNDTGIIIHNDDDDNDGCVFIIRGIKLCKDDIMYPPHKMRLTIIDYDGNSPKPDDVLEITVIVQADSKRHIILYSYEEISSSSGMSINDSIFFTNDKYIIIRVLDHNSLKENPIRISSFTIDIGCDRWFYPKSKDNDNKKDENKDNNDDKVGELNV